MAYCASDLVILHTNDWQSRLLGFPNADFRADTTDDGTKGGVSRLAKLIQNRREAMSDSSSTLLLDAGDFTMGTLFHTITREVGSELQLMAKLGYDAICLGNHEFDFRVDGLVKMIRSAQAASGKLPPILASNIVFAANDSRDDELSRLMDEGVLRRFVILNKGGKKYGVIGLMGLDAAEVAPNKVPVTFSHPIESARELVTMLRTKHKVDGVIALSHGGIEKKANNWEGEDVELAKAVKGIDVIVSGHSHTPLFEPIRVGKTLIVQAGSDTRFLGELRLESTSPTKLASYKLHQVDHSLKGDQDVQKMIDEFKKQVTERFLKPAGYQFADTLVKIFEPANRDYDSHILGNILAESIRRSVNSQIGFIPNGSVRDDLVPSQSGELHVSDIFRLAPLGIGDLDDSPGYPLIKIYMNGAELKGILEILLLAHKLKGDSYFPRYSGVKFRYNPYRIPLDQVMDIHIKNAAGHYEEIDLSDTKTLYSVGTSSYVGKFFWLVDELSYGLIKFQAKDQYGTPISNTKDAIVMDSQAIPPTESKLWRAVVDYFKELGDKDSKLVPVLDYSEELATSPWEEVASLAPHDLIQNATWIQWSFLILCLTVLSLVLMLVRRLLRRKMS